MQRKGLKVRGELRFDQEGDSATKEDRRGCPEAAGAHGRPVVLGMRCRASGIVIMDGIVCGASGGQLLGGSSGDERVAAAMLLDARFRDAVDEFWASVVVPRCAWPFLCRCSSRSGQRAKAPPEMPAARCACRPSQRDGVAAPAMSCSRRSGGGVELVGGQCVRPPVGSARSCASCRRGCPLYPFWLRCLTNTCGASAVVGNLLASSLKPRRLCLRPKPCPGAVRPGSVIGLSSA